MFTTPNYSMARLLINSTQLEDASATKVETLERIPGGGFYPDGPQPHTRACNSQHIYESPTSVYSLSKLPSSCSVETCQLAAVETASIAGKYLRYIDGILNSQFAFSASITARISRRSEQ
jgi:hypothetical protein